MAARTLVLVVVVFATLLLTGFVALAPTIAGATPIANAPGSGTASVVNKIPDFYAEGKGDAYTNMFMKISSKGGYLNTGTTTINLTPWGYVSADWTIGRVYIILLANVTENNFYIAYLYLTNSTSPMIVRLFEYKYATLRTLTFSGVQYVFARYTTTISRQMPSIQFTPRAQPGNALSAIGPDLYLNQNSGRVLNGTDAWTAFPLLEQYFDGATDYNEMWTVFTDESGGYYFGIFYMPNSNRNQVILEHQVRLNDYATYAGRSFDATWTNKGFPYLLSIKMPQQSIVKVNGFDVESDSQGLASIYVPKASITIEAPDEIGQSNGTGSRTHFASWSSFGNINPITIKVGSDFQLAAQYKQQFLLTVDSPYGNVQGAGWYDQGANATISAPTELSSDNGTRRFFLRWEGDLASSSNSVSLVVDSAKHVNAIWKTQFDVKLQLVGVPSDANAQVSVNGQLQTVSGATPAHMWVDDNTQLSVQVQSNQITQANTTYNFGELRVDNQSSGSNILITKPTTVDLIYSTSSKSTSSIDLNVTPDNPLQGQQLTVTGKVNAQINSPTVNLYISWDNANWQPLADVSAKNDGTFSYAWKPERPGTYFIRAYWSGNEHYESSSRVTSFQLRQAFGEEHTSTDFPTAIKSFMAKINDVPVLSAFVGLSASLLTLGLELAALSSPGGSQVLGYFIGSLLIGFVFIFPISAVVLSLKAARSRRGPGVIGLIPLAAIWVGALVVLLGNGILFVAPGPVVDLVLLLMLVTNVIFMPLAVSVGLARIVAS